VPRRLKVENGREVISKALDKWACEHDITLYFSLSGKPTDNALSESFNRTPKNFADLVKLRSRKSLVMNGPDQGLRSITSAAARTIR
jgi:transposase InsO family protein